MKYIFIFLIGLTSLCVNGQNKISPITINLPANPPANTKDWATTLPPVMILAQTKLENGRINPVVIESRILVTIKSGGNKICGSYTANNAPMSSFNTVTKNWTGENVLTLLGQECILKPGTYELCVQFYPLSAAFGGILGESCKPFTIADNKEESYSPPQNISPIDGKSFKEAEVKVPLTFRWTPLVPKPKEPVTYRLKVWQLMQGQTGVQAMRSNTPVVEKDVNNITQAVVANIYTGPCKPPYLCDFVWQVQALNKEGKQMGSNNGTSELWNFKITASGNTNPPPPQAMMGGANAEFKIDSATCLQKENGLFKYHIWGHYKNMVSSSNNILLNDALNFPGYIANPNPGIGANLRNNIRIKTMVYNGALTMNDILEASSGTISNITPAPASLSTPPFLVPNSSHNFQFDYTTATNAPVQFTYYGLVDDGLKFQPNKNSRNEIDSLKFPKCPCSACDEVTINTTQQGNFINNGNGSLSFAATVSSSTKKVKRIRAELVYFDMKPDDENCFACNKNSSFFGNFSAATTTNTNFTSLIQQPHSAQFDALGSINISGGVLLNFTVTIPPMVSCCNADVNFCIRYVITYEDCTVCNKLTCYNYKIVGCQK
jgi:hypothetical protein